MTSFQLIIMGFAGVILLGTVLLMLPFSSVRISSFTTAMMLVLPKTLSLCSPAKIQLPDLLHQVSLTLYILYNKTFFFASTLHEFISFLELT